VIPIADQHPVRRIPVVTLLLIAACVVVYFVVQPTGAPKIRWDAVVESTDQEDLRFAVDNAAIPCELVKNRPLTEREFRRTFGPPGDWSACSDAGGRSHAPGKNVFLAALTTMFLHGSLAHLFGNMLFLWVFGNTVEQRAGSWRYLLLYLAGGAVATIAHVAVGPNSTLPIVGASGAIAAVMGAYFVLWPSARIKTVIVILPVFLRKVMALWLLVVWVGQQFLLIGLNAGVAWGAHLGGFAFGVLAGLWWRAQDRRREQEPLFSAALGPA
jgi:membrane associated rhomboid family serine protease